MKKEVGVCCNYQKQVWDQDCGKMTGIHKNISPHRRNCTPDLWLLLGLHSFVAVAGLAGDEQVHASPPQCLDLLSSLKLYWHRLHSLFHMPGM
ncbi:hypothetical protein SLEP1_g30115 [Rubroshorea leprosula]|uniref:Uncharacterized protein n=1 Tax=Rubroshorea leprosula TaxID=152421 RepID=A0AAV5K8J6_9ROSI|nr:hypothetical protein SLEP1_g30115 [Rubroshorea leprosula]